MFMAQSILSNLNMPNFLSIFRAFVRLTTYFGLPEVAAGRLCGYILHASMPYSRPSLYIQFPP